MQKLAVIYRSIKTLKPYERNARTHSEAQLEQLKNSITEFGFTNPILVDEKNGVIAGHGRLEAAKALGFAKVPTITLEGLTEAQRRAYILADNKIALNAGWDENLLRLELVELQGIGFDIGLTGFDLGEIGELLNPGDDGLTDPDEVPEAPVTPVSVAGDVWELGTHRIICGSSTDAETVSKLLGPIKPHLMVTDPPYGVEYDASWRERAGINMNTAASGKVLNDDRADWSEAWALFPGDVAYVWHAGLFAGVVAESLIGVGLLLRSQIIWAKSQMVMSRGDYHWQHGPCWYAVRKGKTGRYDGGRKQTTLWQIDKPNKSETGHSTQKPVECMKRPIENNSSPGQAVYEPFSGSGTTIIAGEMTGRQVFAIELNPAYVDVAATRWAAFTGKAPVLLETGETFAEVQARRLPEQTPRVVEKKTAKRKAKATP